MRQDFGPLAVGRDKMSAYQARGLSDSHSLAPAIFLRVGGRSVGHVGALACLSLAAVQIRP